MARSPDSLSPANEPDWLWDDGLYRRQSREERERAVVGSMLGLAVGDAIGLPYEGLSPRRAERILGPPDRHRFLLGRGMVSDDTEHAYMAAHAVSKSMGDETVFARELSNHIRNWVRCIPAGIGLSTLRASIKLNLGVSPLRSGVYSAGNGPAMRAPILGASVDDLDKLRALIAVSTQMTHTDPRAEHGALVVALAARAARLTQRVDPPQFVACLKEQVLTDGHSKPLCDLLDQAVDSFARDESTPSFAKSIGLDRGVSGYMNHTVPVVLHACWTHATDFREAVRAAILCGGDADTTAAIVGGIVGANVGKSGIPPEWLTRVWEWPRSISWMEKLAKQVALNEPAANDPILPGRQLPAALARNAFFAGVVLFHGLRRLLPPY